MSTMQQRIDFDDDYRDFIPARRPFGSDLDDNFDPDEYSDQIDGTQLSGGARLVITEVSDVWGSGFEWEIRDSDDVCRSIGFGDTPDEALATGKRVWDDLQAEKEAV